VEREDWRREAGHVTPRPGNPWPRSSGRRGRGGCARGAREKAVAGDGDEEPGLRNRWRADSSAGKLHRSAGKVGSRIRRTRGSNPSPVPTRTVVGAGPSLTTLPMFPGLLVVAACGAAKDEEELDSPTKRSPISASAVYGTAAPRGQFIVRHGDETQEVSSPRRPRGSPSEFRPLLLVPLPALCTS
jgi:lipoprotein-anchoring transpeptidase ErfK/SrfK